MYIQELIGDADELMAKALSRPGTTQKQLAKLLPEAQIEIAMKAIAREVEYVTIQSVQKEWVEKITDMMDAYVLMNGEWKDVDAAELGDYENGLDDAFEALIEPLEAMLSKDWLGKFTIDTRLYEDGEIVKLSEAIGKEVYKTLSYNKTAAQVLSNAGIGSTAIETALAIHMQPKTKEEREITMAENEDNAQSIASKVLLAIGTGFDALEVYDDVAMLFEDDAILANAAAARLGIDERDVETLQMASLEGVDADSFMEMLQNAPAEEKPKPARKKAADKAPAEGKPTENLNPGGSPGVVDAQILALLKEHGGTKDTDMSAKLGASRGSYNNWINGKNAFTPDDAQRETLRNTIVAHINGLHEALALLDGNPNPEVIF